MPEDESEWLRWSEDELIVKGRMYFYRPDNDSFTGNQDSINIKIDKNNVINENGILGLLERSVKEAFDI